MDGNPVDVGVDLTRIAANATPLRDGDAETIRAQIGREPRGLAAVGARCACGAPAVTITRPRLPDGTPFPTLFYLTHPRLVRAMSRLEATGFMARLNARLAEDGELAAGHAAAHASYLARRALLGRVPEIEAVSAGGMPGRVKCLHALAGFAMSAGRGVCPVGDIALAAVSWDPDRCRCDERANA